MILENISYKRLIKNFTISLILGIIIPLFLITVLDPNEIILNREALIFNGIIYIIAYSIFGIFKKHHNIRFFIGIGYLFIQVYFFIIGNNVFTLYLPHLTFGILYIDTELLDLHFSLAFDYMWVVIWILGLKGLNLIRNIIKPAKEEFNSLEIIKINNLTQF